MNQKERRLLKCSVNVFPSSDLAQHFIHSICRALNSLWVYELLSH